MHPNRSVRTVLPAIGALAALLALGTAHGQSATDASGKPVGTATDLEIKQTDGLIRYGDADEMWERMSASDQMGDLAAERWPEIDRASFDEVGSKEELVALVADGYSIDEADATREVNAWVSEKVDKL